MHLQEYANKIRKFCIYRSADYPFLGLAEEAGEVLGKIAKFSRKHSLTAHHAVQCSRMNDELHESLEKELGDVAFMWVRCCHEAGLNPSRVLAANVAKLEDRLARSVIDGSGDNR